MVQSCSPLWNFLLIMAGSLASVSVHIMLKKTLLVPLSNWNLIFWRGLFQMLLSVVFILKNRKRGISTFPVSKYHLISGSLTFVGAMFMLDISQKNLLSPQSSTAVYLSLPLIVFTIEHLCHRRMIFNWAVSALVFIFWSLAIVAYSGPNSQEKVNWHVNCQDGVFAWPISISNRKYKSELLLGYALAFLALITSASSLMVHSFDKFNSWPLFLFWQALGGLLAASLGLVSIEGWPKWHQTDWWYPLIISLVGSFANFSLVKVILSPLNSQDSLGTPIKTPLTSLIIIKVSVESLVLLFVNTNYSQLYETNVILAVFFITTCFIVVCSFPRKNV